MTTRQLDNFTEEVAAQFGSASAEAQPDGGALVTGYADGTAVRAMRLNAAGNVERTFRLGIRSGAKRRTGLTFIDREGA